MIRTILGLAVAGIALAPFAEKSDALEPGAPWVAEYGVDPIVTSVGAPALRQLRVATADGHCMISIDDTPGGPASVEAEPSCIHVFAGLEKANVWTADGGSAAIADASGHVIMEFGASDGFAYEGTSAAGGVVTLTEAEI